MLHFRLHEDAKAGKVNSLSSREEHVLPTLRKISTAQMAIKMTANPPAKCWIGVSFETFRECLKCVDSVKMTPALNLGAAMASTRGHCSERRPPERENKERKWVRSWREGGRSVGRRSGHPEMNKH